MFFDAFMRRRAPIGRAPAVVPCGVRRRPHVSIRRPCGEAKRMRDLGGAVDVLIAHEAGKDREPGSVSGCPGVRPPAVDAQIEDRARAGIPSSSCRIPARREELVEHRAIAIDDEEMSIAGRATARNVTFDKVRLRPRFIRYRIARQPRNACVALGSVLKGDRHSRLIAGHDYVRNAVRRRPEVRMKRFSSCRSRRCRPRSSSRAARR